MKMLVIQSSKMLVPTYYTLQSISSHRSFIYTLLLVHASVSFATFPGSWNVHSVPLIPSLRNQTPLITMSYPQYHDTLHTFSSFTQFKKNFPSRTSITDSTYSPISEDDTVKNFHLVVGSTMHTQQETWQSMKDTVSKTSSECFHLCFPYMCCFTFHRFD